MRPPRMRLPWLFRVVTTALAAVLTRPAFAQWNGAATMNYGMGMAPIAMMVGEQSLGRMSLQNARSASPGRTRTAAPTAADAARFDFTRSPEVSDEVREQVVAAMTQANPANRPVLEQAFANDAVFTQFKSLLARYGLSPTNVVDVMAGYSLITWGVATGGKDAGASSARAVRAQLLRAAMANAAMQKTSDADRQKLAEVLAFQVVMETTLNDAVSRQDDPAKVQSLRAMVRQAAMRFGPDPTRLKLTGAGFVRTP
jgi:hypothetical protein